MLLRRSLVLITVATTSMLPLLEQLLRRTYSVHRVPSVRRPHQFAEHVAANQKSAYKTEDVTAEQTTFQQHYLAVLL